MKYHENQKDFDTGSAGNLLKNAFNTIFNLFSFNTDIINIFKDFYNYIVNIDPSPVLTYNYQSSASSVNGTENHSSVPTFGFSSSNGYFSNSNSILYCFWLDGARYFQLEVFSQLCYIRKCIYVLALHGAGIIHIRVQECLSRTSMYASP